MTSSKGFQHHFNIISKFVFCGCYMKKNAAFALISFAVLKWHECLSFQLLFELTVEIPVQLHLELEMNLLVCNVIEREIKREKVQMKPPVVYFCFCSLFWTSVFRGVEGGQKSPLLIQLWRLSPKLDPQISAPFSFSLMVHGGTDWRTSSPVSINLYYWGQT